MQGFIVRRAFSTHLLEGPHDAEFFKVHFPIPNDHRKFFDELSRKLGIKKWEDWYNITYEDVKRNPNGSAILSCYNYSAAKAVINVYPELQWKTWKFKGRRNFWKHTPNLRMFFDDFMQRYALTLDDFYQISREGTNFLTSL